MVTRIKDTGEMIRAMRPRRAEGTYVFCTTRDPAVLAELLPQARGSFRESEGLSLILPLSLAQDAGFDTDLPMAQITLQVYSALDGVGLTAAVATALARAGIPCNMVAAFHHDHAFVPDDRADEAVALLTDLAGQTT